MTINGRVLELTYSCDSVNGSELCRLWIIETHGEEICVYVEHEDKMPRPGEAVWWDDAQIYFDRGRGHLSKVGGFFKAPVAED